jgi:regulatory protein
LSSIDLEKIKHYCAYQERCHSEVRSKLLELKVYGLELENYISILIEENFLNEERYACSYARGKFRFKQWGKTKIKYQLKAKQISPYLINKAMQEIDDEEYWQVLTTLAEKKSQSLQTEKNRFIKSQKIRNYLLQKGFESGLIYEVMKDLGIAE